MLIYIYIYISQLQKIQVILNIRRNNEIKEYKGDGLNIIGVFVGGRGGIPTSDIEIYKKRI